MDSQNIGFLSRTLRLASPKAGDLRQAYRSLAAQGSLEIRCEAAELEETLAAAERTGFCGMRVETSGGLRILAWKGKEGSCHDTGRSASYRGAARAAMDDDRHLLSGKTRICEKTARLFAGEAYRGVIEVTDPEPGLAARLSTDPAPFEGSTLEEDARRLASALPDAPAAAGDSALVYYPGPFRLLVLADGSVVRRGRLVRLPALAARDLERLDGARINPEGVPGTPAPPESFPALFRARGAGFLLEEGPPAGGPGLPRSMNLDALDEIPRTFKRRLGTCIARGEEYFILTGSDPGQKDGCCPSTDVGFANRLVQAGILDSQGADSSADCPVTLYAFATELRHGSGKPDFVRNDSVRTAIRERLREGPRLSRKAALRLAFLAILLAAAVTLAIALVRQVRG